MPDDLIRRSDAKAAMIKLVLRVLKPSVTGPWERSINEALDSVPAADGRWEKSIQEIDDLRCKLFGEGDTAGESALHTALSILDKHLTSRHDAAKE